MSGALAVVADQLTSDDTLPDREDRESELVARAKAGDQDAFGELVRESQRSVSRLAWRFLRDADLADSVAQEAFLKAWKKLSTFRGECPFEAWVSRIAVNLCRDQLKRKKVVVIESRLGGVEDETGDGVLDRAPDLGANPEGRTLGREIGRQIARAVADLPRMQREVFARRYYQEEPLAEIAKAFSVDVGTVKTHLFRTTRRVREVLEVHHDRSR